MEKHIYVINIDWVQVHCTGITQYPKFMRSKRWDYGTKDFLNVDDIYLEDQHLFTVISKPRSKVLSEDTVIIKIQNRILYEPNPINLLKTFIKYCNLTYKGITRFDICADMHTFSNGLSCNNFIKKFMLNEYLKTKSSGYKLQGNQTDKHIYEYLKIGSRYSSLSGYLYNKTKEMQDKKMKNYIVESWAANGLDINKDIWRLEFSIRNSNIKVYNQISAKHEPIDIDKLDDQKYLEELYFSCLKTAWTFKHNQKNKKKAQMRVVKLFDKHINVEVVRFESDKKDSSRFTKSVINFIENMNCEVRAMRADKADIYKELSGTIAEVHNLKRWYEYRYGVKKEVETIDHSSEHIRLN